MSRQVLEASQPRAEREQQQESRPRSVKCRRADAFGRSRAGNPVVRLPDTRYTAPHASADSKTIPARPTRVSCSIGSVKHVELTSVPESDRLPKVTSFRQPSHVCHCADAKRPTSTPARATTSGAMVCICRRPGRSTSSLRAS
jgi:hypothetical protein